MTLLASGSPSVKGSPASLTPQATDLQWALKRLYSPDTILRKSCDASMVAQALIDAMMDLFFAVSAAYEDIIGDLELDILRDPSIKHTRLLYILQSELTLLRNHMAPNLCRCGTHMRILRAVRRAAQAMGGGVRDVAEHK